MAESNVTIIPIIAGYYYSIDNLNNHTLYYKEKREVKKLGNSKGGTGVMSFVSYWVTIPI